MVEELDLVKVKWLLISPWMSFISNSFDKGEYWKKNDIYIISEIKLKNDYAFP